MKKIYQFSGYIIEVTENEFTCLMNDITESDNGQSHMTIDKKHVRDFDQHWIKEGHNLSLLIRTYTDSEDGHCVIKFKKAFWKKEHIEKAKKLANELFPLGWLEDEDEVC